MTAGIVTPALFDHWLRGRRTDGIAHSFLNPANHVPGMEESCESHKNLRMQILQILALRCVQWWKKNVKILSIEH